MRQTVSLRAISLRATFSVADLRNEPEQDYEDEEGQQEENEQTPEQDDTIIAYPISVELTISKVGRLFMIMIHTHLFSRLATTVR